MRRALPPFFLGEKWPPSTSLGSSRRRRGVHRPVGLLAGDLSGLPLEHPGEAPDDGYQRADPVEQREGQVLEAVDTQSRGGESAAQVPGEQQGGDGAGVLQGAGQALGACPSP